LLNDRLRIEDQIWIRYFQQISSLALTEHLTYLPAVSVLHLDQMPLLRSGLMSATPQVLWSLVKCSGPEENWARKKTGPRRKLGPEENCRRNYDIPRKMYRSIFLGSSILACRSVSGTIEELRTVIFHGRSVE
jgi:hypothetical protein